MESESRILQLSFIDRSQLTSKTDVCRAELERERQTLFEARELTALVNQGCLALSW